MRIPTWRFREKQRAEIHQNPVNTEFFAQQDVAERLVREAVQNVMQAATTGPAVTAAERLVREAVQNVMDAARDGETARLVFNLTSLSSSHWDRYFGALWPH